MVRPIQRRPVHRAHVVQRDRPRRARQRHRLLEVHLPCAGVHRAAEIAVGVVVIGRAGVAARDHQQRAVGLVAVVQQHPHLQDVVVRVGIEGPVGVPLHGRAVLRVLHVHLAVVEADVVAQQGPQDLADRLAAHQVLEAFTGEAFTGSLIRRTRGASRPAACASPPGRSGIVALRQRGEASATMRNPSLRRASPVAQPAVYALTAPIS